MEDGENRGEWLAGRGRGKELRGGLDNMLILYTVLYRRLIFLLSFYRKTKHIYYINPNPQNPLKSPPNLSFIKKKRISSANLLSFDIPKNSTLGQLPYSSCPKYKQKIAWNSNYIQRISAVGGIDLGRGGVGLEIFYSLGVEGGDGCDWDRVG